MDCSSPDSELDAKERARLVQEHFDYVWRLLRRLGLSVTDADDAAQEVFLVGLRKWDRIAPGRERSFLYGCALNKAAQSRAARAQQHDAFDPEQLDSDTPTAEELLDRKNAQRVLDRVLDRLNDDQRVVFVLYEIEELTLREVAELLQIPMGTAASRLRLARARVQNQVMLLTMPQAAREGRTSGVELEEALLPTLGEGTS